MKKKFSMTYANSEGKTFGMCLTSLNGYSEFSKFAYPLKSIAGLVEVGQTPEDANYYTDPIVSINKIVSCMYDHNYKDVHITTDIDSKKERIKIRVEYGDGMGLRGVSSVEIDFEGWEE